MIMDDFLLRAVVAGLGVALVTGPLGVFVVWRRMAYFGDTLAHSALLGVALGILLGINLNLSVILLSILLALILVGMNKNRHLSHDTQLGILAHSALSLGLVVMAFQTSVRVDLMAYLFGDILAVNTTDLLWVWGGGLVVLSILMLIWKPLLSTTVHEELAHVEGTPVVAVRLAFMLLIALVIAVSMKIVGVLLVTSMMIIPAAAARSLSRTPEQMALLAAVMGAIAVILGLAGSWQWDTPAGPSVVVAAALLFSVVRIVIPAR
nr:zinc ABC transporter permease subunit ZnuB [Candidatus Thiodiazotropha endoloripes]